MFESCRAHFDVQEARPRRANSAAWPAHPEWLKRFLEVLGTKIEP